jgi:hypothetical protein
MPPAPHRPVRSSYQGKMGWLSVADPLINESPPTSMVLFCVVLIELLALVSGVALESLLS